MTINSVVPQRARRRRIIHEDNKYLCILLSDVRRNFSNLYTSVCVYFGHDRQIVTNLGKHAVIPGNVDGIRPRLPFLRVLLDGIAFFARGYLEFRTCVARNLTHEIEDTIAGVEGDRVPRRNRLRLRVLEVQTVLKGADGTLWHRLQKS